MKPKHLFLTTLLLVAGCSLIWTPTATVKQFMAATQKGDVNAMTRLFSSKAIEKMGRDTVDANNKSFADYAQRAAATGGSFRMEKVEETATPEGKRISFSYKNDAESISLIFDLSKEGAGWKIDDIGGGDIEQTKLDQADNLLVQGSPPVAPPLPSPADEASKTETKTANRMPIEGGVLNGKAISLPKPSYPPIAKAARASGTVVVRVTIDENGNVISAHAVSGHPLLQAAAVVAARGAKFPPTKLAGEPAKVNGVLTYTFVPE